VEAADDPQGVAITQLLAEVRSGKHGAWSAIVESLYDDLRRIARGALGAAAHERTLQTTGLVHEAWLRLASRGLAPVRDRRHFFALAALVMRQVVCDYARERLAAKRGGGIEAISLAAAESVELTHAQRFVDLDAALQKLETLAPRQARVVECRFFLGLTDEQTAECLDSSVRTVRREWATARDWLQTVMSA